jgi:hypothetical protein
MKMVIIDREIELTDVNGQVMAIFLMLENDAQPREKWVKGIPTFSMYEAMRHDMSSQIIVYPGMIMPDTLFLGYLAKVVYQSERERLTEWHYQMRTVNSNTYHQLTLRRGMSTQDIANLTGYDLEKVRDFYRDYFIVNGDD